MLQYLAHDTYHCLGSIGNSDRKPWHFLLLLQKLWKHFNHTSFWWACVLCSREYFRHAKLFCHSANWIPVGHGLYAHALLVFFFFLAKVSLIHETKLVLAWIDFSVTKVRHTFWLIQPLCSHVPRPHPATNTCSTEKSVERAWEITPNSYLLIPVTCELQPLLHVM